MPKISPESLSVTKLRMLFNDQELASGTGFWMKQGDQIYIATNRHNVTGRNNDTNEHLSKTLAEPNSILFHYFHRNNPNEPRDFELALFQNEAPIWLEHPTLGSRVDAVLIPIPQNPRHFTTLAEMSGMKDFITSPGDDAFALGYPSGIDTKRFPIWKRCSVASEPEISVDDLPLMLVDGLTVPGMSGSPVFLHSRTVQTAEATCQFPSPISSLIGIYSGRVPIPGDSNAHLGRVWKYSALEEIADQRV